MTEFGVTYISNSLNELATPPLAFAASLIEGREWQSLVRCRPNSETAADVVTVEAKEVLFSYAYIC